MYIGRLIDISVTFVILLLTLVASYFNDVSTITFGETITKWDGIVQVCWVWVNPRFATNSVVASACRELLLLI